ncbi:MAG: 2-C-methyl-D-erythritol 4-phosphate cytidylyltransferase [Clostridia bacterium]|nr:2-C-methyl-D-erythritol 4-phosphate cytidylyltransferase [Clostridia bacterium]
MITAIIIAGGQGSRMRMEIPKQFLLVYDKPVIIYTLESFQKHPEIDAIEVVCLAGWEDTLRGYAAQYGITKLTKITGGGSTGQESIRNGVFALREDLKEDDIAIIHDGIRPLVEPSVLSDVIRVCRQYGNGVTSTPYNDQIFRKKDEISTVEYIPRETLRKVTTPQAYRYGTLLRAYERAFAEGIGIYGSSYTNTMMVDLGETLYFATGSEKNMKLTTQEDLELFKAYLRMGRE